MSETMTEADVKVIVQEYMDDKVVYRDNCKERHIGVEDMKKDIQCIRSKLSKFNYLLFGVLISIITTLVAVILK